jgi:Co/Zn/Cd efflux system component
MMHAKVVRVILMFILTITIAVIEIVCGIRAHSQTLIADGLYSFAEGICLIGVILVLQYSHVDQHYRKNNTFGSERSELLFGLVQEVFLLSISLGIIVDAVNHLVNPIRMHDANRLILLGGMGVVVGLVGMAMFCGYHHDHNIEEEINTRRKSDLVSSASVRTKFNEQLPMTMPISESIRLTDRLPKENERISTNAMQSGNVLDAFTYENVEIKESRIYVTLHALCLHSFVRHIFIRVLYLYFPCFII